MAYIGNGRTLLIFGPNVRDDIVPDGVSSTFQLSQEVPGGYEGNVIVVRKRYLYDELVAGTSAIDVDGSAEIISVPADQDLAAALSIVQVAPTDTDASNIHISGSTNGNDGVYKISQVDYDGTTITIHLVGNLQTETGNPLTVSWGRTVEWEILEPEIDYVIGGTGADFNQLITFGGGYIPSVDDQVYVIHKGEATYNFVPSQASVGPSQLQHNLRNFVCDRYEGTGSDDTFTISQYAVNAKTLVVTVDGVLVEGRDPEQPSVTYDWELVGPANTSIQFSSPPANGAKIRILHLGFSTVSRRSTLSPGQVGALAPGIITNAALAPNSVTSDKIDNGAVEESDLADDNVTGQKILLVNNTFLRWKEVGGSAYGVLKLDDSDQTVLQSPNNLLLRTFGSDQVVIEDNIVRPAVDDDVELGTDSYKWKSLKVKGDTELGDTTMDSFESNGNSTVNGNLTITGTVDNVDISDLQNTVATLQTQVNQLLPAGTMIMWMIDGTAPTGWLRAQGQEVSRTTYPNLFAAIGTTFNVGGESSANFRLPDMRQKFPLGKSASGTGSGWGPFGGSGGAIDHTHVGGSHTHGLSNHTHGVPAHYHSMGAGADLAISSSGTHTTSITHTHQQQYTGTNSNGSATNEGQHGHNLNSYSSAYAHSNINSRDSRHGHSGDTGYTNTSHRHRSWDYGSWNNTGNSSNIFGFGPGYPGPPENTDVMPVNYISSNGNHIHAMLVRDNNQAGGSGRHIPKTGGSYSYNNGEKDYMTYAGNHSHAAGLWPWNSAEAGSNHRHSWSCSTQGGHEHTIKGTITAESTSKHYHTITMKEHSQNSSSNGAHTHSSGFFSGRIGTVTGGQNGNGEFATTIPNINSSDSGGAVATSGNNPPFQTVHYIIKT